MSKLLLNKIKTINPRLTIILPIESMVNKPSPLKIVVINEYNDKQKKVIKNAGKLIVETLGIKKYIIIIVPVKKKENKKE